MRDSQGEPQFQSATRIDDFALRAASAVTLDSLNREDIVKVFSSKISRVIILASANIGQ